MLVSLSCDTGKDHVRQVITVNIGIDVVGNAVVIPAWRCYTIDITGTLIIGEQKHCYRGNSPVVISVVDIIFNKSCIIAANFGQGSDACDDALLFPPLFQSVRPHEEDRIIGNDDQVFNIVLIGLQRLDTIIVHFRQLIEIDNITLQNGIEVAAS